VDCSYIAYMIIEHEGIAIVQYKCKCMRISSLVVLRSAHMYITTASFTVVNTDADATVLH
jgi:hypothetical protein